MLFVLLFPLLVFFLLLNGWKLLLILDSFKLELKIERESKAAPNGLLTPALHNLAYGL